MIVDRSETLEASELENAIRSATAKVALYVANAAVMGDRNVLWWAKCYHRHAMLCCQNVLRLDGNREAPVPMWDVEGSGGVFDAGSSLFEMRQANVATAIGCRTRVLGTLIGFLQR
ncbi:MAG: hypothetical protein C0184_08445 [Chloroflexus aggregans]|uniref:Uncharacterized protein n=2 Tax=Chloroflexus TaxID=1107 RepID=A0A2J6X4G5_9CHLR|nr:MAG: hypothetical protein C0184_08445 [Chloroflexus aggregans]